ncbi:MAG: sensor histidine kinase [Dehalococcoidia bacterium]
MVQVATKRPLLCRVLRECRDEIVERSVRLFIARYPDVYQRRLRDHPGRLDAATSYTYLTDLLLAYLSATDCAEQEAALQGLLAHRRELGRCCAEEDHLDPADLIFPPCTTELTAQIMLERYAQQLTADELRDGLTTLHTVAVDMTTAVLYGYISYKEEVLTEQQGTVSRLLDELTHVEGNERRSLALELHDSFAQRLVALSSGIQHCERLVERDTAATHQELERLGRVARDTIRDVRALIRDLHIGVAGQDGGLSELPDYISDLEAETGIRHDYRLTGRVALPPAQEAQVIRIIQEALNNVYKHAGATQVEVRVEETGGAVTVSVRDNGRGFDVETARSGAKRHRRFGLSGMQERAQFLGASLTVESASGSGTTVRLHLNSDTRHG